MAVYELYRKPMRFFISLRSVSLFFNFSFKLLISSFNIWICKDKSIFSWLSVFPLPEHLRFYSRILDSEGEVIVAGRDFADLQQSLRGQQSASSAAAPGDAAAATPQPPFSLFFSYRRCLPHSITTCFQRFNRA